MWVFEVIARCENGQIVDLNGQITQGAARNHMMYDYHFFLSARQPAKASVITRYWNLWPPGNAVDTGIFTKDADEPVFAVHIPGG